jgi:putative ABC transport system permease protein
MRTAGDPLALAAAVRSQVLNLDADQPPYDLRSLEQLISDDVSGVDYSARFMIGFGILALVLASAGIFAVMAYSVLERTHEIGVRMALGAGQADVLRLVIGNAGKLAAVGLGIGVAGAWAMTRLLTSLLLGVVRMDLVTFGGLTALLAAVAVLAAYLPASWAAKVEPMEALRYE